MRDEWKERERQKALAAKELALKNSRLFWAEENLLGCQRGCWERGLIATGDEAMMRARIMQFEEGDESSHLMDEAEKIELRSRIKNLWAKAGLNNALKACKDRRIWPGGHLPEMRDRLFRYDTGEQLSV